jgi:hypothetical protein
MPLVGRTLTVYFYTVEPMTYFSDKSLRSFKSGNYPVAEVLKTIRKLDPASEDYRILEHLFGGETFCVVHDNGPEPILGVYYKDNLARPFTEYKGEISELVLREGEALVDAAFAAFFPGDVVGLVRTSSKAPGFAKLGQWLTLKGRYACGLIALRDPDTLAQLDREPAGMHRLSLRMRANRITSVAPYSANVAAALRAAATINDMTDEVGLELRMKKRKGRPLWSQITRQEIEGLLAVLPDFEQATVHVSGRSKPFNLLRANIQQQVSVVLKGNKRVGPAEAANALFDAYAQERNSIEIALAAARGSHANDPPPG